MNAEKWRLLSRSHFFCVLNFEASRSSRGEDEKRRSGRTRAEIRTDKISIFSVRERIQLFLRKISILIAKFGFYIKCLAKFAK